MIERVLSMISKKDNSDWQSVNYPPSISKKVLGIIPPRLIILFGIIYLEILAVLFISRIEIDFKNILLDIVLSFIFQILLLAFLIFVIIRTIIYYRKHFSSKQQKNNKTS